MDKEEIKKTRFLGNMLCYTGRFFNAMYYGNESYDAFLFWNVEDLKEGMEAFRNEYEAYSKQYSKEIVAGIIESCFNDGLFDSSGDFYSTPEFSDLISADAFENVHLLEEYFQTRNAVYELWKKDVIGKDDDISSGAEQAKEVSLPSELDTEGARKYFARAIEGRYMKKEGNGYKWLFGDTKGQVRLGYFCSKVFTPPQTYQQIRGNIWR